MKTTLVLEMMRGSKTGYVRRGGNLTPEKVPFQQLLPLKLKNKVSGKSDKSTGSVCVQEMSVLFSCLKKNDFNNMKCNKELETFEKCYSQQMALRKSHKDKELVGTLSPGEKRLSHRQVNELLGKYPS